MFVHYSKIGSSMSAQKRTFSEVCPMSAIPPKADIVERILILVLALLVGLMGRAFLFVFASRWLRWSMKSNVARRYKANNPVPLVARQIYLWSFVQIPDDCLTNGIFGSYNGGSVLPLGCAGRAGTGSAAD
jgi:hypothetical protein